MQSPKAPIAAISSCSPSSFTLVDAESSTRANSDRSESLPTLNGRAQQQNGLPPSSLVREDEDEEHGGSGKVGDDGESDGDEDLLLVGRMESSLLSKGGGSSSDERSSRRGGGGGLWSLLPPWSGNRRDCARGPQNALLFPSVWPLPKHKKGYHRLAEKRVNHASDDDDHYATTIQQLLSTDGGGCRDLLLDDDRVEEDDQEGGKKGRRIGIAFLAFLLLAATVLFVVTLQLEWTLFSTPQVNNQSSTTNHSSLGVPDQDGGGGEEAAVHWWNRLVNAWARRERGPPLTDRWRETRRFLEGLDPAGMVNLSRLDCARVLRNDTGYIDDFVRDFGRVTFQDPPVSAADRHLPMDCAAIRQRHLAFDEKFHRERGRTVEKENADYPLAYARIVNMDYVFLEMELAAAYSSHNWYCYAVDENAEALFKERIHALAACLPNVVVVEGLSITHGGHNMTAAYVRCLEALERPDRPWRYVALLQNHDVTVRTNREAVQVYRWLNGANDVEVTGLPGGRVNESEDWSFKTLRLFRNKARNFQPTPINGYPPKLVFSKGYVEASLTREMVKFMLHDMDLSELVHRVEEMNFGIDEIIVPTLHASDSIQAPGGFTRACMDRGIRTQHITRMSIWYDERMCGTHHMRNAICVFGLEDLASRLALLPHLFANKLLPEFDFGAMVCWYESIFNRTHLVGEDGDGVSKEGGLDRVLHHRQFYADLPTVRFQEFRSTLIRLSAALDPTTTNRTKIYDDAVSHFNCTGPINPN